MLEITEISLYLFGPACGSTCFAPVSVFSSPMRPHIAQAFDVCIYKQIVQPQILLFSKKPTGNYLFFTALQQLIQLLDRKNILMARNFHPTKQKILYTPTNAV